MKHRCSGALHLLADDTSLIMEYWHEESQRDWHKGSFYVIDKADRDLKYSIRIKKDGVVIWSTMNGFTEAKHLGDSDE